MIITLCLMVINMASFAISIALIEIGILNHSGFLVFAGSFAITSSMIGLYFNIKRIWRDTSEDKK